MIKNHLTSAAKHALWLKICVFLITATSIFVACKKKDFKPDPPKPIIEINSEPEVIVVNVGNDNETPLIIVEEVYEPSVDSLYDVLNQFFKNVEPVRYTSVSTTPQKIGNSTKTTQGSLYCESTNYKLGMEFNEGFLLDPQTDVIFPGAIIKGNTIYNGQYIPVVLPRTGGTITTDIITANNSSKVIQNTSMAHVQQGVIDLLQENVSSNSVGSQINFEILEIKNISHLNAYLNFSLGLNNKNKIISGFNFSSSETLNRFLVRFNQIYYTISYAPKYSPAEYFMHTITTEQLQNSMGSITPVYVSNVKYGRVAYYCFETTMNASNFKAELEAAFSYAKVNSTLSTSFEKKISTSNTKISGLIIGGSAKDAVQSINSIDGLKQFIINGGEFSASSPGLPIAYTLRSLTDNSVFNVKTSTEYTVSNCRDIGGGITLLSARHSDGNQNDEIWGTISVATLNERTKAKSTTTVLFDRSESTRLILLNKDASVSLKKNDIGMKLMYEPDELKNMYLILQIDLKNGRFYSNVAAENHSGKVESKVSKEYKIKFSDIIENSYDSYSGITFNADKTLDIEIETPENEYTPKWCYKKVSKVCVNYKTYNLTKAAAKFKFSFEINLNK